METKNITKIEYTDSCPFCGYSFKGSSEGQIKYNMKVHCMQKHNKIYPNKKLPKNQTSKQIKEKLK